MPIEKLLSDQLVAGKRYAAAVAELKAAYIELAAIDAAMANANVNTSHEVVPTFFDHPDNIGPFAHPIFAPLEGIPSWRDAISERRDALITTNS